MPQGVRLAPDDLLSVVRQTAGEAGHAVYVGLAGGAPCFARPEEGVLVLGPPRSGKTSSIVVPNVLAACGPVLVASTKRDILDATHSARSRVGECALFDPGGEIDPPRGMTSIGWSPLRASGNFDGALLVVEAMVAAARPATSPGEVHWVERASALLAPLFHAGALDGAPLREVVSWVDRRETATPLSILAAADAERPCEILSGIARTEEREQSGIWSTASGVLAAYRSESALRSGERTALDASAFVAQASEPPALYICASGQRQRHATPLVAGLVEDVRAAAYARSARCASTASSASPRAGGRAEPPVLAVLDELSNIAPIRELPRMVSEGGSQGFLTLACLQDLSQARARWGDEADGFLSLFGTKVFMNGIGDIRTLEAVSALFGEHDVTVRSSTSGSAVAALLGRRRRGPSTTVSTRRERRLPVDAVATGRPGEALVISSRWMGYVGMTPYHRDSPWREAAGVTLSSISPPLLQQPPARSSRTLREGGSARERM